MSQIPFRLRGGLLYVTINMHHEKKSLHLKNCIFDTGSAGVALDANCVATIGLTCTPESRIKRLATAGGFQRVFTRRLDCLKFGDSSLKNFEVEIGDLSSSFNIDAIIGTSLIKRFNWKLNFQKKFMILEKYSSKG